MNHLYIQTAFLGDLLLSVPSLRQIRRWSPQSKISLVCRKGYGSFFEELQVVDEIFEVDKKNKIQLAKDKLQDRKFNTIFCPHQSTSSQQLVKGLKADLKIGYKNFWNFRVFDRRVGRHLAWPEAMRQLQLVAEVDKSLEVNFEAFQQKPDSIPQWADMKLNQLSWSKTEIQKLIDRKIKGVWATDEFICLAPGSVWPTKRWKESHFEKVATALARQNLKLFILGAPDERYLCERVQSNTPNSFSFAGHLSIKESLKILSASKGLICNDSGAMHLASLLQLPTIAIFGPTVQELGYKPWNPKAVVLENRHLLCRPCGQHGGLSCPIGTHRCMTEISPAQVVEQALIQFR